MPLFVGHTESDSPDGFRRATYEWDDGSIVVEPGRDGGLRLAVSSGPEREEHDLHFDPERLQAISSASKLIQIEEIGKAALDRPLPHVDSQSKLITIEDTRGRQLAALIVAP
ncbi:MAG: hypothetical protein ACJ77E_14340 [Gaiellaceae bacterium]